VAYFDEYGRTSETRRRIVGQLVPIARQTGDVTLEELSRAWTDGSIPTDPRYARAFLAAYLLSRTTSERLVVRGAIDQLLLTGDRDRAFERTFGMTATEFDRRFRQWLAEQ
jgi:hypothetical protein